MYTAKLRTYYYNSLWISELLPPFQKKKKDKPWFSCPTFDCSSYLKKLWKKLKRQVTYKILIMFYHLATMKVRIIKIFHIRRIVKVRHRNPWFVFFFLGRREYSTVTKRQKFRNVLLLLLYSTSISIRILKFGYCQVANADSETEFNFQLNSRKRNCT